MKIKCFKYAFSLILFIIVFMSNISFGAGSCDGQGLSCPESCHFKDNNDCTCIKDGTESDPCENIEPEIQGPTEPAGQIPSNGQSCEEMSCAGAGEKWDPDRCKCVCDPNEKCCGVQLNMPLPFIGDCIELNTDSSRDGTTAVTSVTAFPILMQGLMKLLMSAIMVFSFLMIIVSGLMIVSGAFGGNGFATGKKIIKNVIISLILLGCSGLILSLINPSFFGG